MRSMIAINNILKNVYTIINKRKLLLAFSLLCLFVAPLHAADEPPAKYTIKITSPSDSETFQNDVQSLPVSVSVEPALKPDDDITVMVDGQQAVEPTQDTTINLPWMPRGSHTLQAKVIQKDGPGAESELITIFQQRTNLNSPTRRGG